MPLTVANPVGAAGGALVLRNSQGNTSIELGADFNPGERGLIARGCGRSYGDTSTNDRGHVVDMTGLDAIESFDPQTGLIVCQAGVTMAGLVDQYLMEGFVPPVCPGTGYVTVGGAVANDVHGKNHDLDGSFGDHVAWIELLLPSGEQRRLTEDEDSELFRATIGGIGLTGGRAVVAVQVNGDSGHAGVAGVGGELRGSEPVGIDPYNSGQFDRSRHWDSRFRN